MQKPQNEEFAPYYATYINLVHEPDGIRALEQSGKQLVDFLTSMPPNKGTFRYQPEKWSVNEVLQHIIDCELIFLYRALRIARNDQTPLPGFEQDDYVPASMSDYQSTANLLDLFVKTRELSIAMFKSFPPQSAQNIGIANGFPTSVRAICFTMSGHVLHHLNVLKERYA